MTLDFLFNNVFISYNLNSYDRKNKKNTGKK